MFDLEAGNYFFHYTTRQSAFDHILPERQLRLSPYVRMRDPLEAQAPWLGAGLAVPEDAVEEEKLQFAYFEAQRLVAERRAEAKLLSLTIDASADEDTDEVFGRGYSRARMWEQYAETHRGVCLVFKRAELAELVERQIETRAGRSIAGPVRYSTTGLQGTAATTLMPTQGVTGENLASEHLARHAGSFFFLKLADWESEHEYRFVELTRGDEYTYVDFDNTLAAVILGEKFPAWQIYGAIEMCKPLGAKLWQMAWQMNRPLALLCRLPDGRIVEADGNIRPAADEPLTNEDLTAALSGKCDG